MRNKRFFLVLVGALIFGVLAAVSVSRYLSSAQAYTKNLNKIAVAKVAIPIGQQDHSRADHGGPVSKGINSRRSFRIS